MAIRTAKLPRPIHLGLAILVLLTGCLGSLAWVQPALAAFTCPTCFGFARLAPDLYAERNLPAERHAALLAAMAQGEARVRAFYGPIRPVLTLACATQTCASRVGLGGSRGVAYATFALQLSPSGLDPVIIAHERSHIELHRRIGLLRWARGAVPSWFDEGVAVLVSDDPRYLRPEDGNDRCLVEPRAVLPENLREWLHQASAHPSLYAEAACSVSRWMAPRGGPPAILALLDRVAAGDDFATAYTKEP